MPAELPAGFLYREELVTESEEAGLLRVLSSLDFDEIRIRGQAARRTARHYGRGYDYERRKPEPGEPMPEWLLPLRERSAELAGVVGDELVEALVQRYPPGAGIGWHRDAPAFGVVVGVSLGSGCRLRFRRGRPRERTTAELELAPRSGYVLAGEARWRWEHGIPPTRELRYSVTFRTLRDAA
jgi:alkylated DNA repair protein (DNA oxidative demethylase)